MEEELFAYANVLILKKFMRICGDLVVHFIVLELRINEVEFTYSP